MYPRLQTPPTLYADVVVTFPAAGKPGTAAREVEAKKARTYQAWKLSKKVSTNNFSPLAFEAYGRIGVQSEKLIAKLATRSASERGAPPAPERQRWREILSLRLMLDQAEILLNG